MRVLWKRRDWRLLLNLIDHLPRHSYFVEALLDDDDFAAAEMARRDAGGATPPRERMSEWSGVREALARVEDSVRALTTATIAAAGGKPRRLRPVPRPETAMDRAERQRLRDEHDAIAAVVLGRKEPGG